MGLRAETNFSRSRAQAAPAYTPNAAWLARTTLHWFARSVRWEVVACFSLGAVVTGAASTQRAETIAANALMWACPERPSGFAVHRHVDNSSADWRLALSCGGEVARRRKLQFANFSCSRPLVEMEVSERVCQKLVGQRFDYRHSPTNRFRYIGPPRRPPWHQTPKVSQGFFYLVLAGLAVTQDLPFRLVP